MGFLNRLFRKKEVAKEEESLKPLHIHTIIGTPYDIESRADVMNKQFFPNLNSNEVEKYLCYPNLPEMMFDISFARDFYRGVLSKGKMSSDNPTPYIRFYHVDITFYNEDDIELVKNTIDDGKSHLPFNRIKSIMDITFVKRCDDHSDFYKNFISGVETKEEFDMVVALGYDKVLNTTIKDKYYRRFEEAGLWSAPGSLLELGIKDLGLRTVIDIFEYQKQKDNNFADFNKDIQDTIVLLQNTPK